jgi:hypothetical protein
MDHGRTPWGEAGQQGPPIFDSGHWMPDLEKGSRELFPGEAVKSPLDAAARINIAGKADGGVR